VSVRILQGDCRVVLAELPEASVHCCVTSPPYFGLRDYGVAGQIGLEPTPDEFVAELVAVFREVRRVLRDDGTLWLNLGDSYAGSWGAQSRGGPPSSSSTLMGNGHVGGDPKLAGLSAIQIAAHPKGTRTGSIPAGSGLKPKDLIGIPWRVAFALQADGWYLRQDIIWSKPNPMPESVRDRCTKAHEYLFLLSKSERYYFDSNAIAEPSCGDPDAPRNRWDTKTYEVPGQKPQKRTGRAQRARAEELAAQHGLTAEHLAAIRAVGITDVGKARVTQDGTGKNDLAVQALADEAKAVLGGYYREFLIAETRNKRSVWTVATEAFKEAHFATFPPALIEPCIAAGCHEGGTVLDPFGGAGTTGLVADRLQRSAVLIELNPAYADMARGRIHGDAPLFADVTA
jgi:DNA modification methylase